MAEASKEPTKRTDTERAEDVAYTINHAIACTATDLGAPLISHQVAKKFFHSHSSLSQWFVGEGIGDIAAVPVTIGIERAAPGFTRGVRKGMEKTFGWAFRKSAHREAGSWARKRGLGSDSPEARQKEQQIYNYEIEHLPQAAIWTATSMVLNIATQKAFQSHHEHGHEAHEHAGEHAHEHEHGHGNSVMALAGSLLAGKLISTGAVIAFRAGFPDEARTWDDFTARHVFKPINRATDGLLGGKPPQEKKWEQRVSGDPSAQQATAGR